jgi:hypothetical protein
MDMCVMYAIMLPVCAFFLSPVVRNVLLCNGKVLVIKR